MDEQTTQPQQITSTDPQQDFSPAPEADENINTEISFDDNGDVNFSDDYLAEQEKHFFGEQDTSNSNPEPPQQPNYYTDEELANTPYEQWDINRLNGDIKKFVPFVQQQISRRNIREQVNQRAQQLPEFLQNQPQQYTPKELSEEAQRLACERLGLTDSEDFDEYDGEHRAALNLAMQELAGSRQAEIAEYGRRAAGWQQLQNFNRELVSLPDYQEFDRWYVNRLREMNVTPQQVNAYLYQKAIANGYNFNIIPQEVSGWYREFLQTKSQRPRAQKPPVLESTRGGNGLGSNNINLRNFGDMDLDRQADALIRMGVV